MIIHLARVAHCPITGARGYNLFEVGLLGWVLREGGVLLLVFITSQRVQTLEKVPSDILFAEGVG